MSSKPEPSSSLLEQYRALLSVAEAINTHRNLEDLLHDLSGRLSSLVKFDYINVLLHDGNQKLMRLHLLEGPPGAIQPGMEVPIKGTGTGWVWQTQKPLIIHDIDHEDRFPLTTNLFRQHGLHSLYSFPLTSATHRLGTMGFGCRERNACSEHMITFLQQVVGQVAVAVDNVLNFQSAESAKETLAWARDRKQLLLEVSNAVVANLTPSGLLQNISGLLRRFFNHDYASVVLLDEATGKLRLHALDAPEPGVMLGEGALLPFEDTPVGLAITTNKTVRRDRLDVNEFRAPIVRRSYEVDGIRSICCVPLNAHEKTLGTLNVVSLREAAFTQDDAELLEEIAAQVAIAVENAVNFQRAERERDRSQLLLEISNAVVSHLDLKDLVKTISASLRDVMPHDAAGIALYEPELNQLREYTNVNYRDVAAFKVGDTIPLEGTPAGQVFVTGQPLLLRRPNLAEYPADRYSQLPVDRSPKSACLALLTSHGRRLGIVGISSTQEDKFTNEDLELFCQISGQVAIAVENALNFEQATKERERAEILLQVNNAITTSLDLHELLRATSNCLRRHFKHDVAGMALFDAESGKLRVHTLDSPEPSALYVPEGFLMPLEGSPAGKSYTSRQTVLVKRLDQWESPSPVVERAVAAGIRSSCNAPLVSRDRTLGAVVVASRSEAAFTEADAELLGHIARQLAIAVENALQYREIEGLKNKLASEKVYLEEEIKSDYNFAEIVGQSAALKKILQQVQTVAPTDSAVLLCGETGTGKELIARAIHDLSTRRERTLVKLNCAAIPTGLLESELFGHEKGAFTGAIAQRVGRFELANKGTLLLDEVGEIPLDLQPKLLRVLQEQEFERLGSSRTIKTDARLIAATNCDLPQMVAEKKFRSDLFYRLNVFPITIPPLRERTEDIPLLVGYFAKKHSLRMNKRIDTITKETVDALCSYPWPGNVRELENFIERAVILTSGSELQAPLSELTITRSQSVNVPPLAYEPGPKAFTPGSLEEVERAHIEEILRQTRGVIGGKGGAAELLGLPISTLRHRMKKLGLK